MKEKYVVPESRLYTININENIAGSGAVASGDNLAGSAVIKFTHATDGCRGYYTGDMTAQVTVTGSEFSNYYNELNNIGRQNPFIYWSCFKFM